jgi:tellurite resistance protein TerC
MTSLVVPAWAWALLAILLCVLVSIDLFAHRGDRADSRRGALVWSIAWIVAALAFAGFVAGYFGADAGEKFLAAYLLEKSLSVDNLFLFLVIFSAFGIRAGDQRRVLTWGILGALVTRGVFIAAGVAVLRHWHEVTYVFGGILVVTALKMLRPSKDGQSKALAWLERHLPWTRDQHGHRFFARVAGNWVGTPLLLALLAIELTDVLFAIDSIPAALAITDEPFLVYSSNVFAVLGLRALYIVLANALGDLRYLRFGLSAVLAFAGAKMIAARWVTVPPLLSIAVIAVCIGASVVASAIAIRRDRDTRLGSLTGGAHGDR